MEKVKKDFNSGRRSLSKLAEGTHVVVQDHKTKRWMTRGVVLELRKSWGSYLIEIDGRRCLRNRKMLRPCLNQDSVQEESVVEPEKTIVPILRRSERLGGKKKTVHFKK